MVSDGHNQEFKHKLKQFGEACVAQGAAAVYEPEGTEASSTFLAEQGAEIYRLYLQAREMESLRG